jgi:hypothetical protein
MTTNVSGSRRLLVNFGVVFLIGGMALIVGHVAAPETPQFLATVAAPFLLIVGGALAITGWVHFMRHRGRRL